MEKGFTLIELIVAIAVFLLIIGVAITIFISIVINQRIILSQQQLLNQTSYVEEYMSKALRMAKKDATGACLIDEYGDPHQGYIYLLTRPDTNLGIYKGIKFINANNNACTEFFLDDSSGAIILKEIRDGSDPVPLTSEKLEIISVRFGINGGTGCYSGTAECPIGASENDVVQPRVTISIEIKIAGDDESPTRRIQTTVSQRNLNAK
jgi:prepilin-type N-terminal cleavage/methylation domain-containing protein